MLVFVKVLLLFAMTVMYIVIGVFFEKHAIIVEPAAWSAYGAVFGVFVGAIAMMSAD